MPLKLGLKQSDDFFIVGFDDSGAPGALLQTGQTCAVSSGDPNTVAISQDATPRVTTADFTAPNGVVVPAGTQSIASGKVSAGPTPVENTPITITAHNANADGSPVLDDSGDPIPDLTDTVTINPSLLKSEGILFGTPA